MTNEQKFRRLYHEIENDMCSKHCGTSKRFTQKWLRMFVLCAKNRVAICESEDGPDADNFLSDGKQFGLPAGITLHRSYIPIYSSDFYQKDSAEYCGFLGAVQSYAEALFEVVNE